MLLMTLLGVGSLAVLIASGAQLVRPDSWNIIDRVAFPALLVLQCALFVGLWARRLTEVGAGRVLYVLFALYLTSSLYYQFLDYVPRNGHLSESTYWFPVLYWGAFLAWQRREALLWTSLTHASTLVVALVHLPRWWGPDALVDVVPWHMQFFLAGVAAILLLNYLASLQGHLSSTRLVAYVDALTGLPNRRYAEELLRGAERSHEPFALVLFDIDHFKQINDRFGHSVGDVVLREVARVVSLEVRGRHDVARWGGEEFVLILPGADVWSAQLLAERVRRAIAAHVFEGGLRVTASFGVASSEPGGVDALVQRADTAMYISKDQGRDRVTIAELSASGRDDPQGAQLN